MTIVYDVPGVWIDAETLDGVLYLTIATRTSASPEEARAAGAIVTAQMLSHAAATAPASDPPTTLPGLGEPPNEGDR